MAIDLAHLFVSTPPSLDQRELVRALFYNRDRELSYATEKLRAGGVSGQILAIHGATRAGKSHFARRLVLEVEGQHLPLTPLVVDANSKGSARAVLREMFQRLHRLLPQEPPPGNDPTAYAEAWADCDRVKPLLDGSVQEITFSVERARTTQRSGGVGLRIGPQVAFAGLQLDARAMREQKETGGEKYTLRSPTDEELTGWVKFVLALFRQHYPGYRVLFVVDDADLVARGGNEGTEASQSLYDRLDDLAHDPACLVVVTVRQRAYNGRDKEFDTLAELKRWRDPNDTLAVYRRHVERFHEGRDVFTPEALTKLAEECMGMVGMFLQLCGELYRMGFGETLPMGWEAVKRCLAEQFDDWSNTPELLPIAARVREAMARNTKEVRFDAALENNPLLLRVLIPLGAGAPPNTYRISSLYTQAVMGA